MVAHHIIFSLAMAFGLAALIVLLLGPAVIAWLRRLKAGQTIRTEGPASHLKKTGTPTMGGVLMLLGTSVAALLFTPNVAVTAALLVVVVGFGLVGLVDDFLIVAYHRSLGLRARVKFFWQVVLALALAVWLLNRPGEAFQLLVPFSNATITLPVWGFVPLAVFVIVGSSNAVNLTDGLDGLAAGTTAVAALALAFILVWLGRADVAVLATALAGACLAFLWFNGYPAQVFMGDAGSLALGGALGSMAVVTGTELYLAIVGGVFVLETLSVMLQVFSFQRFHRRIFRMTPVHHHFELSGWPETRVVARFWVMGLLFACLGLLALPGVLW
ncbi:MAG: phospho-N-acetylmuramoyl-pentapeptide-transferase [Limnochordaceae bacterium]|nr:phospho-N-acetylmuramoyl-pentapeptide-transferase [Limnochordaceae bacterium]